LPGSVFEQIKLIGPLTDPTWENGGIDIIGALPAEMLMDPGVTIPFLPDFAEWAAYEAARQNMLPELSRHTPAPRYRAVTPNAVGA
jgi:hypothetical protein